MRRALLVALSLALFLHPYIQAAHMTVRSIADPIAPADGVLDCARLRTSAGLASRTDSLSSPSFACEWAGGSTSASAGIVTFYAYTASIPVYTFRYGAGNDYATLSPPMIAFYPYQQAAQPTPDKDNYTLVWEDTDDSDRAYIVVRRGSGDYVKIELQ